MTEFSKKCKQLLLESGSNVYRFSKTYHIDHTTLQRMITGKRLPSQEFVEKFCSFLRITPQEESVLWELYEIERDGKLKVDNRNFITQMLQYIASIQQRQVPNLYSFIFDNSEPISNETVCSSNPVETFDHMAKLVALEKATMEEPCFYTNIPIQYGHFLDELKRPFYLHKKPPRIIHLVTLYKNPGESCDTNYNLSILKEAIPYALQDETGYSLYYYYSNSDMQTPSSLIYPYFLISSTQVMNLSYDCKRAIIYAGSQTVHFYKQEFDLILKMSHPLIYKITELNEAILSYHELCTENPKLRYTFDCFPCLLKSFDIEMLTGQLRPGIPLRQDSLKILDAMITDTGDSDELIAFLPENALWHFCETGRLCDKYDEFLLPFTTKQRREVLERLGKLCESGEYALYLLPKEYMPTFPQINIEIHGNSRLCLFPMASNAFFSFFWMDETSIYDAFSDYFEYLSQKKKLICPNQVPSVIQGMIKCLGD